MGARIIIHGDLFEIKPEGILKPLTHGGPNISLNELKQAEGFFQFRYFPSWRNGSWLKEKPGYQTNDDNGIRIRVPVDLLKEGYAEGNDKARYMNAQSRGNAWNFLLLDADMKKRLDGKLPIINLAGDVFEVKFAERKRLLVRVNSHIELDKATLNTHKYVRIFYDQEQKKAVRFDPTWHSLPKQVVPLEIMNLPKLDPVGEAIEVGWPPTALLYLFPLKMEHTARVLSKESLGLDKLFERKLTHEIQAESSLKKGYSK